jgi:hypothetical protein
METFIIGLVIGGLIGTWIGVSCEARRWRNNANWPWRLVSGGRLYKVKVDEDAI